MGHAYSRSMDTGSRRRVLVVEDDRRTADTIALYLRHSGYTVFVENDGAQGLERALREPFDLLILDRMLPGVEGSDICRRVREEREVPILMLTARVTEREKLEGFDAGADDYVTKPFSPRELLARVSAMMRRPWSRDNVPETISVGPVVLDPNSGETVVRGETVSLTRSEFQILQKLAMAPGRVYSRAQLLECCGPDALERTVDAHVKNLRSKIELDRANPKLVKTVFGRGYCFGGDR